jgi:hypothetical protein
MFSQSSRLINQVLTDDEQKKTCTDMWDLVTGLKQFTNAHSYHWNNLQSTEKYAVVADLALFKPFKEIVETHIMPIHMLLTYDRFSMISFKKYIKLLHKNIDKLANPMTINDIQARYVKFLYKESNPNASKKQLNDIYEDVFNSFKKQEEDLSVSVKNAAMEIKERKKEEMTANVNNLKKMILNSTPEKRIKLIEEIKNMLLESKKLQDAKIKNNSKTASYKGAKNVDMENIPQGGYVFDNPAMPDIYYGDKKEPLYADVDDEKL